MKFASLSHYLLWRQIPSFHQILPQIVLFIGFWFSKALLAHSLVHLYTAKHLWPDLYHLNGSWESTYPLNLALVPQHVCLTLSFFLSTVEVTGIQECTFMLSACLSVLLSRDLPALVCVLEATFYKTDINYFLELVTLGMRPPV